MGDRGGGRADHVAHFDDFDVAFTRAVERVTARVATGVAATCVTAAGIAAGAATAARVAARAASGGIAATRAAAATACGHPLAADARHAGNRTTWATAGRSAAPPT